MWASFLRSHFGSNISPVSLDFSAGANNTKLCIPLLKLFKQSFKINLNNYLSMLLIILIARQVSKRRVIYKMWEFVDI
jgi:hypothetical protein